MYIQFTIKGSRHNSKTPLFKFSPTEDLVAVASGSMVTIHSGDTENIDSFDIGAAVVELSWSADGSQLVALSNQSHIAYIWKPRQRVSTKLTLDVEEPLCVDQSKQSRLMAVGSAQGHLFIYDSFTSSRNTVSSKHSKRISSIVFTHSTDQIVTLSPEALIVSGSKGETLGILRQKALGGTFLPRLLAVQIKGADKLFDAVVVPVLFDSSLQKKMKTELQNLEGLYLLVLNVDKPYLQKQADDTKSPVVDLLPHLRSSVYGNAYLELPCQSDLETLLDIQYIQGTAQQINSHVCCLMSSGQIHSVSLDHSRQDMAVCTAETKFKYFTIVNRREQQFLSSNYTNYTTLLQEMNQLLNTTDFACGSASAATRGASCVSPCTSLNILSPLHQQTGMLVPHEKSLNIYDCLQITQQEALYVDFSGGKNQLAQINGYPCNIGQATSGNVCFICLSNGTALMVLTKTVSQCQYSLLETAVSLPSALSEEPVPLGVAQGILVVNMNSPKTATLSNVIPCMYSAPLVQNYPNECMFPAEPTKLAVSQGALGLWNNNIIQWSRLMVSEAGEFKFSWQSAPQPGVQQLELLEASGVQLAVARLADGQVCLHAGGGLSCALNIDGRSQLLRCSSPFIFSLTEKAVLQVFCIEVDDDQIRATAIARQQMGQQFSGTIAGQTGDAVGTNRMEVFQTGTSVVLYKYCAKCQPQIYLPASETLLDNPFGEELQIARCLFDSSLQGLFVFYLGQVGDNNAITTQEALVGSLRPAVADKEGPGVVFRVHQLIKRDIDQLPFLLGNGVPYGMNNKQLQEFPQIPGLSNVQAALQQLKPVAKVQSSQSGLPAYIDSANPILPVSKPLAVPVAQDNKSYQISLQQGVQMPQYNKIPLPSAKAAFGRAVAELCTLGFPGFASYFAMRIGDPNLLKLVGDAGIRFADFDVAQRCYGELSLRRATEGSVQWEEYQAACEGNAQAEQLGDYLQDFQAPEFYKTLAGSRNGPPGADPSAVCLFLNKIAREETDLNTSMAYGLLLACPDAEQHAHEAEAVLDQAERLLLKSNKPGLALSFRVDALDWSTASLLAKKISSPYVRAEIMIQQAGELEARQQFQEALDVCSGLLPDGEDLFSLPIHIQPLYVGILSRCYCALGKIQECRDYAMPPKEGNKFVQNPRDPLNILQRARLCYDCAESLSRQKRFAEAAQFYEAAAQLSAQCFGRLRKELSGINNGDISLYDVVLGEPGRKMSLFRMLPGLRQRAAASYQQLLGKQEDEKYDIQLLRQIDSTLENKEAQVKASSLPHSLQEVVSQNDLGELEAHGVLSKAASCYIKARLYDQAEKLVEYVTDKQTIADLARVFMREDPDKALRLFRRAGKSIEIVECLLVLGKVQEAESAVKEVKQMLEKQQAQKTSGNEAFILDLENEARQSALLLAHHFRKASAVKKAIFYYILAEQFNEAFELAVQTRNEDLLVRFVTQKAPTDFLKKTAKYFASPDPDSGEKRPRNMAAAARFLELSGAVDNAIKLLLNFGDGAGDIDKAIDLLKGCRQMVEYVLKYLQGAQDGAKKNPIYIFKLYLALDKFGQAANVAFVLSGRQVEAGNFSKARQILLQCMQRLQAANQGRVPQRFRRELVLLHAVNAGREFASAGLHAQAGLCLHRASKYAQQFKEQAAGITLSACVECWRAGDVLRREAYECACVLLKDYQDEIPEKYKKAVDQVVRKYKKGQEQRVLMIKCCQCGAEQPQGVLTCDDCQAILPLDTSNGGQMSLADYCECPYCQWTCSRLGLYEVYGADQIKKLETHCLMCTKTIDLNSVMLVEQANYALVTGPDMNWDEYEHRPLLIFEDSNLARRRYEEWVKMWQADQE